VRGAVSDEPGNLGDLVVVVVASDRPADDCSTDEIVAKIDADGKPMTNYLAVMAMEFRDCLVGLAEREGNDTQFRRLRTGTVTGNRYTFSLETARRMAVPMHPASDATILRVAALCVE